MNSDDDSKLETRLSDRCCTEDSFLLGYKSSWSIRRILRELCAFVELSTRLRVEVCPKPSRGLARLRVPIYGSLSSFQWEEACFSSVIDSFLINPYWLGVMLMNPSFQLSWEWLKWTVSPFHFHMGTVILIDQACGKRRRFVRRVSQMVPAGLHFCQNSLENEEC